MINMSFILIILQAAMYVNVLFFIIALGSITATFGRVLYFEPKSSDAGNTVPCPDGGTCPSSDTCCMLESLAYGCCPLPKVSAAKIIHHESKRTPTRSFCDNLDKRGLILIIHSFIVR